MVMHVPLVTPEHSLVSKEMGKQHLYQILLGLIRDVDANCSSKGVPLQASWSEAYF